MIKILFNYFDRSYIIFIGSKIGNNVEDKGEKNVFCRLRKKYVFNKKQIPAYI